jgi:pimeloyl-ACP methyl ester carboxylesterase
VKGLVSCAKGYNIQDISNAWQPASALEEARYWYMYYFNTRRGEAGLYQNRKELCRHIWTLWSPTWGFNDATFDKTATSFDNPDFVDIVIHSYRHRFGDVEGDPKFDEIEARIAKQPNIAIPTIVMQGWDDGVDPPSKEDFDGPHFTGHYSRKIAEGVGHNFPQEAPIAFTDAVVSLLL